MIIVEVYAENQMEAGNPVATLSFSGKGKKVTINAKRPEIEMDLAGFLDDVLALPHHSQVSPEPRQAWMEALPNAHPSVPYWFKIAEPTSEIIEEVDDDNEEEDTSEEDDNGEDGLEDSSDSGVGGGRESDGESTNNEDGGFPTTNG